MTIFVTILQRLIWIYTLIVLAKVLVSYFLPPYQPVRRFLDRVVEPALVPIRRLLPQTGMVDFSPVVLILALQLIGMLLVGLLR
jgi:YggT family protein